MELAGGEIMMSFPIPMQVHLIWHPASDPLCRPMAKRIRLALTRDAYQPLVPGIGIPVFYRCASATPGKPSGVPRPISIDDTLNDLRMALVTPELQVDPSWRTYLEQNLAEASAKRPHAVMVRVALSPSVARGEDLSETLNPADPRTPERVLQVALLQACRLLGGRPREGAGNRGAAPMKLFLSHTKRDAPGLVIAKALKRFLDGLRIDRFFDEVSIQPGDRLTDELREEVQDAALVAIRTDGYVSSPWCRKELALAKEARRPMVVVDALTGREPRSSPLLVNLPSVRLDVTDLKPKKRAETKLEEVTNFIGLETVRFLHGDLQLGLLRNQRLITKEAILLTRPPEARDLAAILRHSNGKPVFVHPDPVLTAEETEDLKGFNADFRTPTSLWGQRLDGKRIGLSAGNPDEAELLALGLSATHIDDAARILARQVLAAGGKVVYGGTLSDRSLTECIFEMIGAYNRGGAHLNPLLNITPWPWWHDVNADWQAARDDRLEIVKCDPPSDLETADAGDQPGGVDRLRASPEGRCDLVRSLTQMRRRLAEETDARLLLGGRPHEFLGLYPGILEEALLAIERNQPLYVLGAFGGAARLLVRALNGERPPELTLEYQKSRSEAYAAALQVYDAKRAGRPDLALPAANYEGAVDLLAAYGAGSPQTSSRLAQTNGLDDDENRALFETASLEEALHLIMKGLGRVFGQATGK
jgi:hypothetical protein